MFKKLFYIATSLVFLCACQEKKSENERTLPSDFSTSFSTALDYRPNIVWLVAEDMSPYIAAYGDSTVVTPNLDRLAKEGIRYTNVYSTSGVCSPSRYTLMTGRYPSSDGAQHHRTSPNRYAERLGMNQYEVVPPPGVRMYSEVLRESGYYCTNNSKNDFQFQQSVMGWDEMSTSAHWRNRSEGKPFMAVFNFGVTHESQFFYPQSTSKMRFFDNFPNPAGKYGWNTPADSTMWLLPDSITEFPIPPYLPETEAIINDLKTMYNNLLVMDRQIGILLNQLEEDGLLANTIVVWYADHGGPLPRQKRSLKDSGIKVPMFIRFPDGRGAGTTDDQLISFVDFAPTLMSLVNIEPLASTQGQAFAGHYQAKEPRKHIHAASGRVDDGTDKVRAVRNHRYKYLRNITPENPPHYMSYSYRNNIATMQDIHRLKEEGKLNAVQLQWLSETRPAEELYDTWNDPHEINNIAEDETYAEMFDKLRKECDRWMNEIGDKVAMPEDEIGLSFWPNWEKPQVAVPTFIQQGDAIQINCATEGATIAYQLLAEEENLGNDWKIYTSPVVTDSEKKLVAIADRAGWKPSEISSP